MIVVTPEPTSITDAYALIKVMFFQHGTKNFVLLPNQVRNEKEALAVYENLSRVVARFMGGISLAYAGFIPRDNRVPKAVTMRNPVVCSFPDSPASMGFMKLARRLLRPIDQEPMDGNIKFFWKRLLAVSQG